MWVVGIEGFRHCLEEVCVPVVRRRAGVGRHVGEVDWGVAWKRIRKLWDFKWMEWYLNEQVIVMVLGSCSSIDGVRSVCHREEHCM